MRPMAGRSLLLSALLGAGVLVVAMWSPVAAQEDSGGAARPVGAHTEGPEPGAPTTDLFVSGQAAVDRLGDRAAGAAREEGLTADQVRDLLLADPTLFAAPDGQLAFFDPMAPGEEPEFRPEAADGPVAAPPTNGPEFQLASLPGAEKTIYLDFDGHTTTGTSWNSNYNVDTIISPPYDISGDPDTWSATELSYIRRAWALVAEDFAPWNVNVTTIAPPVEDLRRSGVGDTRWGARVVFTDDTFANCGCGGHAFIGAFDDTQDEPTFVYNSGFSGLSEAATHEVGHMLGLAHDGLTNGTTYYSGHQGAGQVGWAPIMGVAYNRPLGQWSQQEYSGANNNDSSANYGRGRDDVAIISSLTNGNNFGLRPFDHGGLGRPTPLTGANPTDTGIITTRDDRDAFSFTTSGGNVSFTATGDAESSNLDIRLSLVDSSGGTVTSDNPLGSLDASVSANLAAGTYSVLIEGVGAGNPSATPPNGYTDYGSLGQYTISGTIDGIGGNPDRLTVLDDPCVVGTGSLAANATATEQITGQCGVPGSGVSSVMVSLTAVNPQGVGNLRLSAAGVSPNGGVVNYSTNGLDNGNTVTVPVSAGGAVDITANAAGTDYRLAVIGFSSAAGNLQYNPVTPCAVADSRDGTGSFAGPFGAGAAYPDVDVVGGFAAGQGGGTTDCGVPAGADAVMVNLVSVGGSGGTGGLAVGTGGTEPTVGTTNFGDGVINNAGSMVVPLDGGQTVATNVVGYSGSPSSHIRIVVLGYYDSAAGADYTPINACAAFDTRPGQGASGGFLGLRNDGQTTTYQLTGSFSGQGATTVGCGVPAGADAVLINLVSIQGSFVGNFRAYATGSSPTGGVLNFAPTSPAMNNSNAVVVPLSAAGQIDLFVNAPSAAGGDATHARGVVLGYFQTSP